MGLGRWTAAGGGSYMSCGVPAGLGSLLFGLTPDLRPGLSHAAPVGAGVRWGAHSVFPSADVALLISSRHLWDRTQSQLLQRWEQEFQPFAKDAKDGAPTVCWRRQESARMNACPETSHSQSTMEVLFSLFSVPLCLRGGVRLWRLFSFFRGRRRWRGRCRFRSRCGRSRSGRKSLRG